MMETVYLGRQNPIVRQLLQDGQSPEPGITRVQARISTICLDTNTDSEIEYADGVVTIELGGQDLKPGLYVCNLTVYDAAHPNGLAWGEFYVFVRPWPVCA